MARGRVVLLVGAVALFTSAGPALSQTFGLCALPIPVPENTGGGNTNVNVTVVTCAVDEDEIVEAGLEGGAAVAVGPIQGIDSGAIAAALAEAAPLLGQSAADLQPTGVTEIAQSSVFLEEVYAISSNDPALLGIDFIGDPSDYSTWIAVGPVDVEVLVSQATLTTRQYRLDLATAPPVPSMSGVLSLALAGAMTWGGVRALRR
ncbi:MAG: hypothetical protein AAGC67_07365 [Myxococcota bacterium]